jgi:hypothetical protein
VIREIYAFIGVDPDFTPDLRQNHNVSGIIKNTFLDLLIGQNSIVKKGLNSISPKWMERIKQNGDLKKKINKVRQKNLRRPPLSTEFRNRMITKIYGMEIVLLQTLINRNLNHWIQTK